MKIEFNVNQGLARRILFFDTWLAPKLILLAYWIMLAGCVAGGLAIIVTGSSSYRVNTSGFGWVLLIFGPLAVRIVCEGAMLLFKINENLQQIRLLQEKD